MRFNMDKIDMEMFMEIGGNEITTIQEFIEDCFDVDKYTAEKICHTFDIDPKMHPMKVVEKYGKKD